MDHIKTVYFGMRNISSSTFAFGQYSFPMSCLGVVIFSYCTWLIAGILIDICSDFRWNAMQ